MTTEETTKVAELLKDERTGLFTTIAPDGTLISRPMALQEVEFDGDLWIFAARGSRKVQHITANPQVNASTSGSSSWVSLTGHAVVLDDLETKRHLWNAVVEAWFPDGPEDPDVALPRVLAASAVYWYCPGGRLACAVCFAMAMLTGQAYDGGVNERGDL